MKPIELTEEHKTKLLEMCKVLFPKYEEIILEIEPQYDGSQGFLQFTTDLKKYLEFESIHWFEFCMTYLVDKIFINESKAQFVINIWNNNPIDYLYEELKK